MPALVLPDVQIHTLVGMSVVLFLFMFGLRELAIRDSLKKLAVRQQRQETSGPT
jgi:hypothetical protein